MRSPAELIEYPSISIRGTLNHQADTLCRQATGVGRRAPSGRDESGAARGADRGTAHPGRAGPTDQLT